MTNIQSNRQLDFLNAVLENAGALLVVLDHDGRIVRFNKACEKLSGYKFGDIKSKYIWDVVLLTEDAPTFRREVLDVLTNNPQAMSEKYSNYWQSKNGVRYFIEWSNTLLLNSEGHMEFMVSVGNDITEKHRIEKQLQLTNAAIEHALTAIAIADLNGKLTYVNPAFLKIWGYASDQSVLGRSATEFWTAPDNASAIIVALQQFGVWNGTLEGMRADGKIFIAELMGVMLRDADGQPMHMLGSFIDVSLRIEAERRYQSVVAAMAEGVVVQQADGQIMAINTAAEEILGLTSDQLRGRTAMDPRWQSVHEDGTPFPGEEHPGTVALRTGKSFTNIIMGVDHPAKGRRWISINAQPLLIAAGEKPYGSLATFTDVTERKAAEDALRATNQIMAAVLDTTPVMIAYLDNDMNFIRVNRAYAEADHKQPEFFIGKNHFALYPHVENEMIFRRVATTGQPYSATAKPFEYEFNPERGVTHWDWTLTPIKDNNNRVTGLVLSLLNVTERIQALEAAQSGEQKLKALAESLELRVLERTAALNRAKDDAEHANRAKSEFLSRMSHELRTPMNAILGFAQVLEVSPLDGESLEFVHEIHRAGDHLLHLINDLLDLSRIESGKMLTVLRPVSLAAVVSDSTRIIQPMLANKNITLHNDCDARAMVLADETRLRQIMVNLLSNAIKYNRNNGKVVVECRALNNARVRITVSDNGRGILSDHLERLFLPFERLGAEFSEVEGSGIGLALSRQLAELMNGTMGVSSSPDHGSTFWIELSQAAISPEKINSSPNSLSPGVAHHTVLYIEDNAANLRLVQAIFQRQQHLTLLSAVNGEYGLELAKRYLPDVILLDIHLPGIDGYEILQALKQDIKTQKIPVIALSAEAMPIDIERGFKAGFVDYLTKPVKVEILLQTLQQYISSPK